MIIPKHVAENLPRLRRFANSIRGLYGFPVFLVGSALSGSNPSPRDWDLRLILPNEEFTRHFGDYEKWSHEGTSGLWTDIRWKWSDECVKLSKQGWRECGLNIDFQIYPQDFADLMFPLHSFPRMQVDSRIMKTATKTTPQVDKYNPSSSIVGVRS
jgi:hypothetical protein